MPSRLDQATPTSPLRNNGWMKEMLCKLDEIHKPCFLNAKIKCMVMIPMIKVCNS